MRHYPPVGAIQLSETFVGSIDGGSATTTLVQLVGTPALGELWRIRIGTLSYEVEVVSGLTDTLARIATKLADLVNVDDTHAARYSVIADGALLIIVDRQGGGPSGRARDGEQNARPEL